MVDLAETVFRDFVTDGVPSSGPNNPRKAKIREWGTWLEGFVQAFTSNGGLVTQTKLQLDADLDHDTNTSAWVVSDSAAANNGIYRKIGASGTGSWLRVADLPYSYIRATDAGAGTANAIQATTSIPIPSADGAALIALNIFEENTGPATVSFNGGTALTIKTNSGADVQAGYLVAGMIVAGYVSGSNFRLISDIGSAADRAAAEAAADRAEAAAASIDLPPVTANTMLVDNAAGTAREAKSFANIRGLLSLPPLVADRTALKALDPTKDTRSGLGEAGRIGIFKAVLTASLSAAEQTAATADTAEGIYITSGSYTWVREEFTGKNFHVGWFHDWSGSDLATALGGAVAVMEALETRTNPSINTVAARVIRFPPGDWTLSGSTIIGQGGIHLTSDGDCSLLCTGTNAAIVFRHDDYLDGEFLQNIKVTNLRFVRASAADAPDMFLRFYVCKDVKVTGNRFENGTVQIQFDAAYEPVWIYANTFWHQDAAKTNAYSVRIRVLEANAGAAGAIVDADDGKSYLYSSMVWIWGNEMRALTSTDVQSHIYCEDIDGMQCFHNHFLNGEKQVAFQPVVRGLGRITNVKIENNMFDGGIDTTHNFILEALSGTKSLVIHMHVRSNKLNESSTFNCRLASFVDEFWFTDNELDLCNGALMLSIGAGGKFCSIKGNRFRLSSSKSPSIAAMEVFATSLSIFKITEIINNNFGEDESGATFPPRAVLLTGNPTNTGTVILDQNRYDTGFAAFLTDNSGANWTVTALTNTGYAS